MKLIYAIALLLAVATPSLATENLSKDEVQRALTALRSHLRDPDSMQIGKDFVTFHRNGEPVICGSVNAKNGYGGYTGYHYFITIGDRVAIYESPAEFMKDMDKYCADAH